MLVVLALLSMWYFTTGHCEGMYWVRWIYSFCIKQSCKLSWNHFSIQKKCLLSSSSIFKKKIIAGTMLWDVLIHGHFHTLPFSEVPGWLKTELKSHSMHHIAPVRFVKVWTAFVLANRKFVLLFCKQHLSWVAAQIVYLCVWINLFSNPFVAARRGAEMTCLIPFSSMEQLELWTWIEFHCHLQSVTSSHPWRPEFLTHPPSAQSLLYSCSMLACFRMTLQTKI